MIKTKNIDLHLKEGDAPASDAGIFGGRCSLEDASLVLLPVPWEATASYGGGTSHAPQEILKSSHYLDLEDEFFGPIYSCGIHMLDLDKDLQSLNHESKLIVDKIRQGDSNSKQLLQKVNQNSVFLNDWVYKKSQELLALGKHVGVIGGDHSCPLGLMKALAEHVASYGILHIDAHMDLRAGYEGFDYSHASIMYNVVTGIPEVSKVSQVAIRDYSFEEQKFQKESDQIALFSNSFLARQAFEGQNFASMAKQIISSLPEHVYISFDIDGLDPSLCPGTGTPVPGGLMFNEANYLIEELSQSGRNIIGFDLCEVASLGESDWDYNVASRILYKLAGSVLSTG